LVDTSESGRFYQPAHVEGSNVRYGEVEVAFGSPATFLVKSFQPQFVDPYGCAFAASRVVAHADEYGFDIRQRGITHDRDFVGRFVRVVTRIGCRAADTRAFGILGDVTLLFQ